MPEQATSIKRQSESDRARRTLRLLLSLLLVLLAGTPAFADGSAYAIGTGGGYALGGGTTTADSNVFTLDLTSTAVPGAGGITRADSADFTLDLTGAITSGAGGTTVADSNIFTLDLTDANPPGAGIGGTTVADSADFVLDLTGIEQVIADSGDFTLDTRTVGDIGLRAFDGTAIIKLAVEPGTPTSQLRIRKNGVTYGIKLVPLNSPDASKIRIQTPSGVKALQKLP